VIHPADRDRAYGTFNVPYNVGFVSAYLVDMKLVIWILAGLTLLSPYGTGRFFVQTLLWRGVWKRSYFSMEKELKRRDVDGVYSSLALLNQQLYDSPLRQPNTEVDGLRLTDRN